MSLGTLGRLGIEIYADTATFAGDLGKVERQSKSFASNIEASVGKLTGIFSAVAAGLGVIKFADTINEVAKFRAGLDDLADAGLGSVEALSRIKNSAKAFGGDFDGITASLGRMVKGLAGSDLETSKAGDALERLGISARNSAGNLRAPAEIFEEMATKLAEYRDGADKTAVVQAILGKGAEKYLPLLKDMAEYGEKNATVTAQQAEEADKYEKALRGLGIATEGVTKKIAGEFISATTAFVEALTDIIKGTGGVKEKLGELVADGTVQDWAYNVGLALAKIVDAGQGVVRAVEIIGKAIAQTALDIWNFAKIGAGAMMTMSGQIVAGTDLAKEGFAGLRQMGQGFKDDLDKISEQKFFSEGFIKKFADNARKIRQSVFDPNEGGAFAFGDGKKSLDSSGLGSVEKIKAAKSDLADIDKLLSQLFNKDVGLESDFDEKMGKLWLGFATGKVSVQDFTLAQAALIQQQPVIKKAAEDYTKLLEHQAKLRREDNEATVEQINARNALIGSLKQHNDSLKIEIDTLGMTAEERDKYLLGLEEEAALKVALTAGDVEYIKKLADERRALIESRARIKEQMTVWDSLSDVGSRFFSDLVMNGRSAFDRLRDSLKSFAAELIALFAKRWILQMVAGVSGSGALAAQAATAGSGTAAGSLLSWLGSAAGGSGWLNTATGGLTGGMQAGWIGSPYAGAGPLADFGSFLGANALQGVGGGLAGYFGSRALGAGQRGQAVGGASGAALSMIGNVLMPGVGAVLGALAGAVIGKLTDPNGLATRHGYFGDSSLGGDTRTRGSSIFGGFGITKSEWFGDDMIEKLSEFFKGLGTLEDSIGQFLNPAEIQRVRDAFAGKDKKYDFGTEHGDFSGTLGQILKDRIDEIINIVDPSLKKWVDSFQGTGDELAKYVLDLLHVREMLGDGNFEAVLKAIPDLTIEGLTKMQQAGEALSDTFTRVVNEFLEAQASLNAAIAARNPTFAREIVLQNRNDLARQFLSSLGLDFAESNLARMALNPQSFTGLNTQQMNWLAQFLNFQTELERLDQALANGTGNVTVSLGNFAESIDNTVSAMLDAQTGLADYLRGSLTSDLSPLTPMQQLEAAKQNYLRNLGLAQSGDTNAISAFGGLRDEYLRIARSIFASSGAYNDAFFSTFNDGAALTGGQVGPLTGATYQAGVQQVVQTMQAVADRTDAVAGAVMALGTYMASEPGKAADPAVIALLDQIRQQLTRGTTQGVLG